MANGSDDRESPAATRVPAAGKFIDETDAVDEGAGKPGNEGDVPPAIPGRVGSWSDLDRGDRAWLRRKVDEALHGSWGFFVRFVVLVMLAVGVIIVLRW